MGRAVRVAQHAKGDTETRDTVAWILDKAQEGQNVVGKLNAAVVEALAYAGVRSHLLDLGMEIFPLEQQTPEALTAWQKACAEKWWPLIKAFGIKAE